MRTLYAQLEGRLGGDSRCISGLLRRDWERRFRGLLAVMGPILRSLGVSDDSDEVLPTPAQIEGIVAPLTGAGPERVVGVVAEFAPRALIGHQMVPWVSDAKEVHEHFRSCVEAEDSHLAVVDIIADLVRPLDGVPTP
jgi:hypothetical protein